MMPGSLRALMEHAIDYAGLYPPASLPLEDVIENYERYLGSEDAWMLNRLVLPENQLREVRLQAGWRVTLLVTEEPGALPEEIETLETKKGGRLSLATYCEVPIDEVGDGWGKVRTTNAEVGWLADFLFDAAGRRLPFKATAGLHHPYRTDQHGFLNVLVAATFAWFGTDRGMLARVLDERDPGAFQFRDTCLRWRDRAATTEQVREARREFMHSFGSCSFEEPAQIGRR